MALSCRIRAALNWTLHVAARYRHRLSDFGVGSRFGSLSLEWVSGVTPNWAQTPISRNSCHVAIMFIVLCALPVSCQRLFSLNFEAAEMPQVAGDGLMN